MVVSFGTGVTAEAELDVLSRALVRAVKTHAPYLDLLPFENPGGTTEVIQNIRRYDLSGLYLDEAAYAYFGDLRWEQPHSELRLLCLLGELPVSFIVAADTEIKDLYGLKGKIIGIGKEELGWFKAQKLLEALDIDVRWESSPWEKQNELYSKKEIDSILNCGAPDPTLRESLSSRPFNILSIPQDKMESANRHYSGTGLYYFPCAVRAGIYPDWKQETKTFGLLIGYFSKRQTREEITYDILKAVWADVWTFSKSYELLRLEMIGFPKLTLERGQFPLHSGAIKFFDELKLEVPKRLFPPEMILERPTQATSSVAYNVLHPGNSFSYQPR